MQTSRFVWTSLFAWDKTVPPNWSLSERSPRGPQEGVQQEQRECLLLSIFSVSVQEHWRGCIVSIVLQVTQVAIYL